MRSQSCHGRLLFKSLNIKVEYEWSAEHRFPWATSPNGPLFVTLKDNYSGTWGHKTVKTDFNKRELSCSNWMQKAKQDAVDGWAHKSFDVPVMRDFRADYPLPVKGASEGYVYFAGIKASTFAPDEGAPNQLPLVNYFALQKYPNQTTPNPDPEGQPIPVPPEPVPLLEKLRKRQPVLPILNSLVDGAIYFEYNGYKMAPFYYLVTEPSTDPRLGHPPNWPTMDDEPLPLAPFVFLLTPDTTIFQTRNDYQSWLADNLGTTKSQIFFPGAPNDPMLWNYGILVDSEESKADFISWRANQDNAPDTLFATEQEWMNFFNARQQNNNVPCGGISQCGASWNLVNDPEQVIECKSSAQYETAPDGPQPPPGPYEGTAKIKVPFGLASIIGYGPWRQYQSQPNGSLTLISKTGNLVYGPWQPSDVNLRPTSGAIQFVEYSLSNLPFFNKNQNGCNAYRKSVQETGFPIKWYFRNLEVPIDLFEDIVGQPPSLAGVGDQGNEWIINVPATFTESDNKLTWEAQANHSDSGLNYKFNGSVKIKVTIEWTDL